MNKKTKTIMIVMVFLLGIILPFVDVQAETHIVEITNPMPNESFSYSTGNEVFYGHSQTSGLLPNARYTYLFKWYIDGISIDQGTRRKYSTADGQLYLSNEIDTTVDISSYSVGEHNVSLRIVVYHFIQQDFTDTHIWSRDSFSPETIPTPTPTLPTEIKLQQTGIGLITIVSGIVVVLTLIIFFRKRETKLVIEK